MIPSALVFHLITSLRRLLANTWPSAVVALAAWISIVVCIDPAGSYPNMPEGPGLTVDEMFNVEQGVLLVEQARSLGWLNLIPGTSMEAFKPENGYLPDHPPLGRYWLGVHHHLTWWLAPPFDPEGPFVTACARTGSATAFALTVWMIGIAATSWFGRAAGLFASLAMVLMPRVYGHAHIASLETITNLTCTAAVLAVAHWWPVSRTLEASGTLSTRERRDEPAPSRRVALLTGIVMGLALLTKIQAVLIPIPVIAWALWRWRMKAIVPLLVWGVTANVVFFALWPYLWLDPVGHFLEYLGRTTNRATIHCFYFGVRYDDKAVPWHYPFVMFAVTVPVGLHVLGALGSFISLQTAKPPAPSPPSSGERVGVREPIGEPAPQPEQAASSCTPHSAHRTPPSKAPHTLTLSPEDGGEGTRGGNLLLLACTVFPLIVFALPGVAVYDGERLFLTVFPLWAIFVGRGLGRGWRLAAGTPFATLPHCIVWAVLLWSGGIAMRVHPHQLNFYSELIGGQSGAYQSGMELDYWGTGITRSLLRKVVLQLGRESRLGVGPTLHPFQADEYRRQSPLLRQHRISTIPVESIGSSRELALIFKRRADLPPSRTRVEEKIEHFKSGMHSPVWWEDSFMIASDITIDGNYAVPPEEKAPSP